MPTNDIQLHLTIAEAGADPEHLDSGVACDPLFSVVDGS
jgi:hypothetical protein